jgi:hypothetical protein
MPPHLVQLLDDHRREEDQEWAKGAPWDRQRIRDVDVSQAKNSRDSGAEIVFNSL